MGGTDIRYLRTRIRSVDQTMHLTSAMGLVASSKMRRANDAMMKGRAYAAAVGEIVSSLTASRDCAKSVFLSKRDGDRTRLVVIAGDRGLCGGYNAGVFRLLGSFEGAEVIPIGKRATDRCGKPVVSSERFTRQEGYDLAASLCRDFAEGKYDRLGILCTDYVSMMVQTPTVRWILPLEAKPSSGKGRIFEPDETSVLDAAVPEYVAAMIMAAVREGFASEVAARRAAMDSADKNARAMIDDLTLSYNRARQSAITGEITEIVAGAGEYE